MAGGREHFAIVSNDLAGPWPQTGEGLDLNQPPARKSLRLGERSEVRSFRQDLRILWIWNPFNLVNPIEQARTHLTNRERVRC